MYRIDHPTKSLTKPTKGAANAGGYFKNGDPATSDPATIVDADFMNMLQDELGAFLDYAGITRDKANDGQVLAAVLLKFATLISPAFTGTPTAPTAAPGTSTTQLATTEFVANAGAAYTGEVRFTLSPSAPSGWVPMNDGTIGSASSGATTRANLDTQALYVLIWTNISNTYAPVTGGRGASALADFGANKPLALPKALGRALAVAGSGSGLTARPLGMTAGVETVALSASEMPVHSHPGTTNGSAPHQHLQGSEAMYALYGGGSIIGPRNWVYTAPPGVLQDFYQFALTSAAGGEPHTFTTDPAGSGAAHTNVQPTTFLNAMIKL